MKKLLRKRDILLLSLAGLGNIAQEMKDPLNLMSASYENMYGFVPERYKKHNFYNTVSRSIKTGDIERIIKDGKIFLRLTSSGKERIKRDFPLVSLIKKWNGCFVVLSFDISEKSRKTRDRLRNKLRDIGFGMLQESFWITPLPIGKDMKELIESVGLSKDVFVLEVSGFLLGNPKDLVAKVWKLDKLEEDLITLKDKINEITSYLISSSDRDEKRDSKFNKSPGKKERNRRQEELRMLKKRYLELLLGFPALPQELLPKGLQGIKFL